MKCLLMERIEQAEALKQRFEGEGGVVQAGRDD